MPASATAPTAPDARPPLDRDTFVAGVLTITAAVLLAAFLINLNRPTPAYAIGQNAAGGDYVLLTNQVNQTQEAITVIDSPAQRMVIYGYDFSRRLLTPLAVMDLQTLQRKPPNK